MVDLYLFDAVDVVCLVHLMDALHEFLCQSLMRLLQAVDGDIDRRDDFYAGRQGVVEDDRRIGHRLPAFIHHHIEIAAIHLIYIVGLEERPFRRVEPQVRTPVVHGVALVQLHPLPASCHQAQQQA